MRKQLIVLALVLLVVAPVMAGASTLGQLKATISRLSALINRTQLAAIGGINTPGLPDLTVKDVKLASTTAPIFNMNLCNNGTASLSDIGSGAFSFYVYTFNTSGALSQRYSSSMAGSSMVALKNGSCIPYTYSLNTAQAAEYKVTPKVLFAVNGLPETDTPDNDYVIYNGGTTETYLTVSNTLAVLGSPIIQNSYVVGYGATYSFTLTNNSNYNLFVAKTPSVMLATSSVSSTGGTTASSTLFGVVANPSTIPGDTSAVYNILPGTSRTFTFVGRISPKAGGGSQTANLKITDIFYGSYISNLRSLDINYGLSALNLTANF